MLGLMQDWPLLCHTVLDHAAMQHPRRPVVTQNPDGSLAHSNWAELRGRALRVAQRLAREGARFGDRIGTLAGSTQRHVEVWYGALGIGAIYHPINPRLFPDDIAWIANHAEDGLIFLDPAYLPLAEQLAEKLPLVRRFIVLAEALPETSLRDVVCYEDWLAEADGDFAWAKFEENTGAGLSYTSGTTGRPKGVLLSHRSICLLSLTVNNRDMYGFISHDTALLVPPMFHANGWSWPFSAAMAGASLVLPGGRLDPASILRLVRELGVTVSSGVPTVWQAVLDRLDADGMGAGALQRLFIGGAACPPHMIAGFRDRYGVQAIHSFGMTEMGPTGSLCTLKPEVSAMPAEQRARVQQTQGHAPYLVEMRLTDDEGRVLPWDGRSTGHLLVRGPAIARAYYRHDQPILDADGFMDTGDIGRIDEYGYLELTDRAKDLIKSGGEWISSQALENLAAGHPEVQEAAVIGVPDARWTERPLLLVVPRDGAQPSAAALIEHLQAQVPRWWLPERVEVVEALPHTATGKLDKVALRKAYK